MGSPYQFEQLRMWWRVLLMVEKRPESMRISLSALLPICPVPASLSLYKPIAGLTATRKMLGYVWINTARDLPVKCFLNGFHAGTSGGGRCVGYPTVSRNFTRAWQ